MSAISDRFLQEITFAQPEATVLSEEVFAGGWVYLQFMVLQEQMQNNFGFTQKVDPNHAVLVVYLHPSKLKNFLRDRTIRKKLGFLSPGGEWKLLHKGKVDHGFFLSELEREHFPSSKTRWQVTLHHERYDWEGVPEFLEFFPFSANLTREFERVARKQLGSIFDPQLGTWLSAMDMGWKPSNAGGLRQSPISEK